LSFPAAIRRSLTGHAKSQPIASFNRDWSYSAPALKKGLNFDPPLKGQQSCPIAEGNITDLKKNTRTLSGKGRNVGRFLPPVWRREFPLAFLRHFLHRPG
jgi:hypothetical protein